MSGRTSGSWRSKIADKPPSSIPANPVSSRRAGGNRGFYISPAQGPPPLTSGPQRPPEMQIRIVYTSSATVVVPGELFPLLEIEHPLNAAVLNLGLIGPELVR